jgi:hypothetical protein
MVIVPAAGQAITTRATGKEINDKPHAEENSNGYKKQEIESFF